MWESVWKLPSGMLDFSCQCFMNTEHFWCCWIRRDLTNYVSPQMQMRFDGLLGFPGGWVFPRATIGSSTQVHSCSRKKKIGTANEVVTGVSEIVKHEHTVEYKHVKSLFQCLCFTTEYSESRIKKGNHFRNNDQWWHLNWSKLETVTDVASFLFHMYIVRTNFKNWLHELNPWAGSCEALTSTP